MPEPLPYRAVWAEPVRDDFIDYPTGWRIQREGLTHTDDRCSAAQSGGAFLCDCSALPTEWADRVEHQTGVRPDISRHLPTDAKGSSSPGAEPMSSPAGQRPSTSCHEVALTIDGSGVDVEWTCSASEGAWCRMTCPEGCEEWYPDHEHTLVDAGECTVLPWLENDAWDENYSGPPQQLRCGPIFVEWDNPGYRWSYDPFTVWAESAEKASS